MTDEWLKEAAEYEDIPYYHPTSGLIAAPEVRASCGLGVAGREAAAVVSWRYPSPVSPWASVAVGYHVVVSDESGKAVFSKCCNFKHLSEEMRVMDTSRMMWDSIVPTGLVCGCSYVANVRILFYSPDQAGTVDGSRFKYSQWGRCMLQARTMPEVFSLEATAKGTGFSILATVIGGGCEVQIQVMPRDNADAVSWDSSFVPCIDGRALVDTDIDFPEGSSVFMRARTRLDGEVGPWSPKSEAFFPVKPRVKSVSAAMTDGIARLTVDSTGDCEHDVVVFGFGMDFSGRTRNGSVEVPGISCGKRYCVIATPVWDGPVEAHESEVILRKSPRVVLLKVDGRDSPMNLSSRIPVFSWVFAGGDVVDVQAGYRVQVSLDEDFSDLAWDSGLVFSECSRVAYGAGDSFEIPPALLSHGSGVCWCRVFVHDGFMLSEPLVQKFAINDAPAAPLLSSPSEGVVSGKVIVSWAASSGPEPDGDDVIFFVEVTSNLSAGAWRRISGPLAKDTTSFVVDLASYPGGSDYAFRVVSSDGLCESTSQESQSGRLTIPRQPPPAARITSPKGGEAKSGTFVVEWEPGFEPDVVLVVEAILDSKASRVGVARGLDGFCVVDSSRLKPGQYAIRVTPMDSSGVKGPASLTGKITICNDEFVSCAASFNGRTYLGTSSGGVIESSPQGWHGGHESFSCQLTGDADRTTSGGRTVLRAGDKSASLMRQLG